MFTPLAQKRWQLSCFSGPKMADPPRCRCEVQTRRSWGTGLDENIRWVELEGPLSRYLYEKLV
jgi:hypothetical protein